LDDDNEDEGLAFGNDVEEGKEQELINPVE